MKKFALIAAALLALALPAAAQFPAAADQPGGPVAIGQAQAQVDPATQKVAIVQSTAPAPAPSGGVIQLSAFGWLQPYVDTVVQGLIVVAFGWLTKNGYTQWMDASARASVEVFVKNRASSLIADGAVRMQDKAVHVDNSFLYRAARESSTAIPDALKRFGLTPDVVAAKIIDAIPQTPAGASIIATAHTEDTEVAPVPVANRPSSAPQVATPNQPPTSA
jgi:hypothetical protein